MEHQGSNFQTVYYPVKVNPSQNSHKFHYYIFIMTAEHAFLLYEDSFHWIITYITKNTSLHPWEVWAGILKQHCHQKTREKSNCEKNYNTS